MFPIRKELHTENNRTSSMHLLRLDWIYIVGWWRQRLNKLVPFRRLHAQVEQNAQVSTSFKLNQLIYVKWACF